MHDGPIILDRMKKHSMLVGGLLIICANIYGLILACIFRPTSFALVAVAAATICLVVYVQVRKQLVLVETYEKESYIMFALLILFEIYFSIAGCALLVYFSDVQLMKETPNSSLRWLVVGIETMEITDVAAYNLPYYLSNFLFFMYYLRCFYVMFWRQNIVFIYRYLKTKVNELNKSLLSHMPAVNYNPQLADCICSLCLQEYRPSEKITRLHCTHIYHLDCVKVWVLRSNCCPLCRKRVIF